jgi:hypothetical protein
MGKLFECEYIYSTGIILTFLFSPIPLYRRGAGLLVFSSLVLLLLAAAAPGPLVHVCPASYNIHYVN